MNKSVARGIALALLSATSFYAAADAHLIRVGRGFKQSDGMALTQAGKKRYTRAALSP